MAELEDYAASFVKDLRQLHPAIEIDVRGALHGGGAVSSPAATVVALIICELLDNAIDAVEPAGTITLELSRVETRDRLQVVVRDSGPGIAGDIAHRVFEEGASTKGSGRGLGLSLVRQAVQTLGGDITYKHDGGAVFVVSLPYEAPAPIG